jgi:drug/metabolite transporter (DMT)-like permease
MSAAVAVTPHPVARPAAKDLASIGACSLIWGTTWYAITLQLGEVPAVASIVYRFALAAALLAGWCLLSRQSLRLTRAQHWAAAGQGLFTFAIDYALVYLAEEKIASAVVAVLFAGLAFVNLILFRLVARQKAARAAWIGAALGIVGVAVLSGSELFGGGEARPGATTGLVFAVLAVAAAAVGNLFAWRGQLAGGAVAPMTAWGMAYGAAMLALYGLVTGMEWRFEASWSYVGSLLWLSVMGSVVAFVLYFKLARSRGYAIASYVSALTPPVAMAMSALFEKATFGAWAFLGLALVLAGQLLLIRAPRAAA